MLELQAHAHDLHATTLTDVSGVVVKPILGRQTTLPVHKCRWSGRLDGLAKVNERRLTTADPPPMLDENLLTSADPMALLNQTSLTSPDPMALLNENLLTSADPTAVDNGRWLSFPNPTPRANGNQLSTAGGSAVLNQALLTTAEPVFVDNWQVCAQIAHSSPSSIRAANVRERTRDGARPTAARQPPAALMICCLAGLRVDFVLERLQLVDAGGRAATSGCASGCCVKGRGESREGLPG